MGTFKETISSCTNCSGEFLTNPTFVCENINGDVCTSDEGNQRVAMFISAGGLRFLYGGKSNTTYYQSFNPRGLATDGLGNILIADYFSHTVHMVDCEGRFLQYISTNKNNFPYALSIDNENRLLDHFSIVLH
ncbi:tripartite motif-containing protein 2-like [Ostrea edulis]|uniref:tripartite motif-containing protein 2-like n=1 Tax=Ostrea edulis TaxID=37623 RepID=UPI0020947331|nr:tripartite motif-containing protein 2-like [Ostrea edulis]